MVKYTKQHEATKHSPGLLTVQDLQQTRIDRSSQNHETYKYLYGIVHRRIQRLFSANASSLTYRVPSFLPDRPRYDPRRAARYIRDKLRRGGFEVTVDGGDGVTLHIDWSASTRLDTDALRRHGRQQQQQQAPERVPRRMNRDDIARRLQALKQKLHA
jgi:hypothetical protein